MSKHTPGPWYVDSDNKSRVLAETFQFLQASAHGAPESEWHANARLIAAAPDLLAVLQEMPDIIKDFDGGNPETSTGWASEEMLDLWQRVNAAIAKAEGTS